MEIRTLVRPITGEVLPDIEVFCNTGNNVVISNSQW